MCQVSGQVSNSKACARVKVSGVCVSFAFFFGFVGCYPVLLCTRNRVVRSVVLYSGHGPAQGVGAGGFFVKYFSVSVFDGIS